ncbi:MAG: rod shape-determining protein MreC [Spirochaetaceae bacterium]|nr:rod shape-determining protein MreC [Spirochaetaceae bacterium]
MKKKRFQLQLDIIVFILLLFVSATFLAFSGGSFIVNIKEMGFSVISQTERVLHSATSFLGDSVSAIRELSELREKYALAQEQLADYEIIQRKNRDVLLENDKLKQLLGFSESISIKNIPAEIIAFDSSSLYNGMVINCGVKKGIKKNSSVVAYQNGNLGLVGKIASVGSDTSIVLPIYDYQCSVASKMEASGYRGISTGNGQQDGVLTMQYVKKTALSEIAVGSKVLTSGFDDNSFFPKNIPIGTVSKIIAHEYETSLQIEVEPIIDFSSVEYVFVLAPTGSYEEIVQ